MPQGCYGWAGRHELWPLSVAVPTTPRQIYELWEGSCESYMALTGIQRALNVSAGDTPEEYRPRQRRHGNMAVADQDVVTAHLSAAFVSNAYWA